MNRYLKLAAASLASATALALLPVNPAYAGYGDDGGSGESSGSGSGDELGASVKQTRVKITTSGGSASPGKGNISSVDPNWTPPVCWYEPVASPKQFKASVENLKKKESLAPVATYLQWNSDLFEEHYGKKSEESPYDNYNIAQQGKGMWWRGVINPNREDEWGWEDCMKLMFWVPNGKTPDAPEAISSKVLAEYAYDSVRVPDTQIDMNPDGKQTVNVPTWIWLDRAKFKPIKVTASLPGTGLWATTTATPVSLHIDPGTTDAEVFPKSGDCPLNDDGTIGTPYTKGKGSQDPPCGVTYLRSTQNSQAHDLKATLTWKISWKGSGGTGDELPDGTFGTTTPVTVQEFQAINR
ncbi:hypothetical protein ACFYYR_16995 [Streptomyces sp. NPDC001922]|uniref:hypothetical protein n=1 Tax=Streptomyces sp. NPDC001922 TaxID=3364624 RepID=UPI0036892908